MVVAVVACSDEEPRPAAISVASAAEVGLVPQSSKIVGHDGGRSATLFGHSVWIYGDTFLSVSDDAGRNFHSNSFAWMDDLDPFSGSDPSHGLSDFAERLDGHGAPTTFFPFTAEEAAYNQAHAADGARWALWPLAMTFDAPRARALVFFEIIDAKPGAWNFHGTGRSLAIWSDFDGSAIRPVDKLFAENEPTYGEAAAIDGERLHTFACAGGGIDEASCTLARVPLASVEQRATWEFWDGVAWSSNIASARPVLRAGSGLCVFRREGVWIATYARPLGNEVVARTASSLTGPWSDEVLLFVADRRGHDGWTYDAYPHPELGPAGGKSLFFGYTRPTNGLFASETVLVRVDLR